MGCGGSSERNDRGEVRRLQIGAPTDVNIHIPRNRLDASGQPMMQESIEVSGAAIQQALRLMATFLHRRGVQLTAITVGGAVNCLLLQTRNTTHDVDIFSSDLDTRSREILDEAMQYAREHSSIRLGTDWLNTETEIWTSPTMRTNLTARAVQQNVVVFREPGLTLLAAPWGYAFSAKIQRLVNRSDQVRPYDLADAVGYLAQIVRANGGQPIYVARFEEAAQRYNHTTSTAYLLGTVNKEFRRVHGTSGIIR